MDRLPNKYQITAFDPQRHEIAVCFENGLNVSSQIIFLPITNGMYPEGEELDNYIMSFSPFIRFEKKITERAANEDYVSGLVQEISNATNTFIDARAKSLQKRALLLSQSDWTQLPDANQTLDEEDKILWAKYRQELRDITMQSGWPVDVIWPRIPFMLKVTVYE